MTKITTFHAGVTPGGHRLRVVNAATGDVLDNVLTADVASGKVTRLETKDGELVRKGDAFVVVDEQLAIRIDDLDAASAPAVVDEDPR